MFKNPYIDSLEVQKCDNDKRSKIIASKRPLFIYLNGYKSKPRECYLEEYKINNITISGIRQSAFILKKEYL